MSAIRVLLDVLKKKRQRKSSVSPAAKGVGTAPKSERNEALSELESAFHAAPASAASGGRAAHTTAVSGGAAGGAASSAAPKLERASAAAAPRASQGAASSAAAAVDVDAGASSALYMQQLPPAVVAMSLLCFLVEMNELERGKRVQLIGPLWLCIPSDSTTTQRDHVADVGVGIGLGRAHSFIDAAGAAAVGSGFGKVRVRVRLFTARSNWRRVVCFFVVRMVLFSLPRHSHPPSVSRRCSPRRRKSSRCRSTAAR